jgi:2-succinyl-5-enolpyruvyl-6-hydroxy-3-cyclohexene-1-carboxylate synthase
VKASYEIAEEASEGDLVWYNVRIMDEAMRLANEGVRGPVHLNFPLREPLYKLSEDKRASVKMISRANAQLRLVDDELNALRGRIASAQKIMVLAGQMQADGDMLKAIDAFGKRGNVAILTEAHSNLAGSGFITTIDRMLAAITENEKQYLQPDLLITVGHNIISRKIKTLLRTSQTEHWHVDISGEGLDTLKKLTKVIPVTPTEFFQNMDSADDLSESDYGNNVMEWNHVAQQAANDFLKHSSWSDLSAFEQIHQAIPAQSDVQMGNSSAVRYILLNDARPDLRYFGNRGVAGIDGCTSTAVGACYASKRLTTLISGDIAFFYDNNAFWNSLDKSHLKIIVINNGGGGIFRIIDGPDQDSNALETFFETAHQRSAAGPANMYGIPFQSANNVESLAQGLQWLYMVSGCAILEVNTPRLENSHVLRNYFRHIAEARKN